MCLPCETAVRVHYMCGLRLCGTRAGRSPIAPLTLHSCIWIFYCFTELHVFVLLLCVTGGWGEGRNWMEREGVGQTDQFQTRIVGDGTIQKASRDYCASVELEHWGSGLVQWRS